ncbi:hypothetical protein [Halomarina litorea]|uniref:hypothetical protein n=1 Tax=Halomarina litorea TaxID=2961595 RepID=UPI0020C50D85|nr:hypothetical protein [Halomarina sp. BCD28]
MCNSSIDSEQDFAEALRSLVREADRNGVAIEGGWVVTGPDDAPGWDVEVVELASGDDEA